MNSSNPLFNRAQACSEHDAFERYVVSELGRCPYASVAMMHNIRTASIMSRPHGDGHQRRTARGRFRSVDCEYIKWMRRGRRHAWCEIRTRHGVGPWRQRFSLGALESARYGQVDDQPRTHVRGRLAIESLARMTFARHAVEGHWRTPIDEGCLLAPQRCGADEFVSDGHDPR